MAPRQKTRVIVAQETTGVLVRRMNVMTAWQNKASPRAQQETGLL